MLSGIFRLLLSGFFALVLFFVACNVWVIMSTYGRVFSDINDLPETDVALVLGTSKKFASGQPNSYFEGRMDAATRLYKNKKVKHLILSGDNRTRYYNEPADMKEALEKRGVPAKAISADNAGLRTLDSVVRSNKIFGNQEIVIVTQRFHTYRAVFIGQFYGINTYGYTAQSLPVKDSMNLLVREFFARPMAVIDLYILNKLPSESGTEDVTNF